MTYELTVDGEKYEINWDRPGEATPSDMLAIAQKIRTDRAPSKLASAASAWNMFSGLADRPSLSGAVSGVAQGAVGASKRTQKEAKYAETLRKLGSATVPGKGSKVIPEEQVLSTVLKKVPTKELLGVYMNGGLERVRQLSGDPAISDYDVKREIEERIRGSVPGYKAVQSVPIAGPLATAIPEMFLTQGSKRSPGAPESGGPVGFAKTTSEEGLMSAIEMATSGEAGANFDLALFQKGIADAIGVAVTNSAKLALKKAERAIVGKKPYAAREAIRQAIKSGVDPNKIEDVFKSATKPGYLPRKINAKEVQAGSIESPASEAVRPSGGGEAPDVGSARKGASGKRQKAPVQEEVATTTKPTATPKPAEKPVEVPGVDIAEGAKPGTPEFEKAMTRQRRIAATEKWRSEAKRFKKPVAEPKASETGAQGPKTTGLANQVQEQEVIAGVLKEVEPSSGKSAQHWQQLGKRLVDEGADYEGLSGKVARGEVELTGENVGILQEGKRRLVQEVNIAAKRLDEARSKANIEAYDKAQERLQSYVENVQGGKGRWSDVGRALQAGTELDTGNFAEVLTRAKRYGTVSRNLEKQLKEATSKVSNLEEQLRIKTAELGDLQASSVLKQEARRYSKADAQKEVQSILDELKNLKGKPGVKGGKKAGAVSPPDFDVAAKQAVLVGRLARAYVRMGAATLEDVVIRVTSTLKEQLGIEVTRQEVIDAISMKGKAPTRSEFAEKMAQMRVEARRLSTEIVEKKRIAAKAKEDAAAKAAVDKVQNRVKELKAQILDMQKQLETGEFRVKSKAEVQKLQEIKNLEAERNVYSNAVKSHLLHQSKTGGEKFMEAAAGTVRGAVLGSDVGTVSRQSFILGKGHPIQLAKSIYQGLKAVKSENGLEQVMTEIRNRRIGDTSALVIRKNAGLQLSDSISHPEEIVAGKLMQWIPGLKRVLGKPLERFQLAQLNTLRANVFDSAAMKGWNESELKNLARFINNVSGRGNVNGVPKSIQAVLNVVMTSPRYEVSRWATMFETVRQPARLVKGLATGKLDKSALRGIKDMGATVAWVMGVYKLAELAGYKTSLDPSSSDFLKLRKGDDVWDISAGIVPRMKTLIAMYQAHKKPGFTENWQKELGKAGMRTISPAVRAPSITTSVMAQRRDETPEEEIKSPILGYNLDENEKSFWAYAPLILQSIKQAEEEGTREDAVWAGVREFFGSSVSRYPER